MSDITELVAITRLVGSNPALVLHGGGNTSLKRQESDLLGRPEARLYVKGSGRDMAAVEAPDFAALRLAPLLELISLDAVAESVLMEALYSQRLHPAGPAPSVESFLHAVLPFPCVIHTHPDAILALSCSVNGEAHLREALGAEVTLAPYRKPGFALAGAVHRTRAGEGLVLHHHGLVTWGDTPQQAYDRTLALVARAEAYLQQRQAWTLPHLAALPAVPLLTELAELRLAVSRAAGRPLLLMRQEDPVCHAFVQRPDLERVAGQGPATPDHVIRTKQLPLVGRDVAAYAAAYRAYFDRCRQRLGVAELAMLDPAPRVILDPALGCLCAGPSAVAAHKSGDLYHHTIAVMERAEALGGYLSLPEEEVFRVEYWDLEQAKLPAVPPAAAGPKRCDFSGEVALVTGAASGIGKACATALMQRGAAVIGLDRNPLVQTLFDGPAWLGHPCDLTDEAALAAALEAGGQRFGGLDMLILNAGLFPPARRLEALSLAEWRQVMAVNLDANLSLLRECHRLLKRAPNGGRVVVIGSKNVPAPGPGAAAYSASKAALNQLARVTALEWGQDNIRINSLHPNAVFDTGLWTDEVLTSRARSYNLTVAQYKTNNLLKTEVTSRDVAELAAEMCGPLFSKTTAAQVPVDGGNERVV